jgi:hypothetical protein
MLVEPSTQAPETKPGLPPRGSNLQRYARYLIDHAGFACAMLHVSHLGATHRVFVGEIIHQPVVQQFFALSREAQKIDGDHRVITCSTYQHGRIVHFHRFELTSGMKVEVTGVVRDGPHQKHMPRTVRRLTDRIYRDRPFLDLTSSETG